MEAVAGPGPLHTAVRLGQPSLVASVSTTLRDPDTGQVGAVLTLELQTKVREDFTITEKASAYKRLLANLRFYL